MQATHHLDEERDDHGPLVADGLDQLGGRRGKDKIGQEECRLGQHGPRIGQVEDRPQMGHQRHVQIGDESEDEKQDGDRDERANVAGHVRNCRRCGSSCHRWMFSASSKSSAPVRALARVQGMGQTRTGGRSVYAGGLALVRGPRLFAAHNTIRETCYSGSDRRNSCRAAPALKAGSCKGVLPTPCSATRHACGRMKGGCRIL